MNGINETCTCGCDVSSHFEDQERPGEHPIGREPRKFRGMCLHCKGDQCKLFKPKKPDA